jgi:hypothetical protein
MLSRSTAAASLVATFIVVAGAGCGSSSNSSDVPTDGGAPDGAVDASLDAPPGQLVLRVDHTSVVKTRKTSSAPWSQTVAYLTVTLANGRGGADVPANVALFSVKTASGISKVAAPDAPFSIDDQSYSARSFLTGKPCDGTLSISGGASLQCVVAADLEGDVVPVEVTYRTPGALAEANGVAPTSVDNRVARVAIQPSTCAPCGNLCTDLLSDQRNCGACGKDAPSSGACVGGQARCNDTLKPDLCAEADGSSYCVDLRTSSGDCGACGARLPSSQLACKDGKPSCSQTAATLCTRSDGTPYCADLGNDTQNCGACGKIVSPTCDHGSLVCPASRPSVCTDATGRSVCTDPMTDYANCGVCGRACKSGTYCRNGSCI